VTTGVTTTYYSAGTQLIAMRVITNGGNTLYFLHGDHLGSTSLTTNASGGVVARQLYDAWGNIRLRGDVKTDIGYTSQREDRSTNLMFYRARYYSPLLGRFVSADTIVPEPNNPQSLNRYAYGLNNPVKYIDPSGHAAICGTTAEGCERSWFQPNTQPHPPEAMNNAWNFATSLIVTVVSIPFEAVDYVATGVQCATSGCTAAEVAITLIPGAIGPVAKGVGKIVGLVDDVPVGAVDEVVESLTDAGKAAENAAENGGSAATALHKNALDYVGDTHVYRIKGPDGSTYKIGQSAQGVRKADGASIRAEQQVRRLTRENGPGYSSQIRRRFPDKRSAYEYENRLIERFRRTYGEDSLPGNLNNH
jgi:RHS repeat-associated protein